MHQGQDLAARPVRAGPLAQIDQLVETASLSNRSTNLAVSSRPALATACSSSNDTTSPPGLWDDDIEKVPS
jgi:hypothetical protein